MIRVCNFHPKSSHEPHHFYTVLGVARGAKNREIKLAYFQMAKVHHPDANRDKTQAEQDVAKGKFEAGTWKKIKIK